MNDLTIVKTSMVITKSISQEILISIKKSLILNRINIMDQIAKEASLLLKMVDILNKLKLNTDSFHQVKQIQIDGKSDLISSLNKDTTNYLDACEELRLFLQNKYSILLQRGDGGGGLASLSNSSDALNYINLMNNLSNLTSITRGNINTIDMLKSYINTTNNTLYKLVKLNEAKALYIKNLIDIRDLMYKSLVTLDVSFYMYNNYYPNYHSLTDLLNQSEIVIGGWLNDKGITTDSLMRSYSTN